MMMAFRRRTPTGPTGKLVLEWEQAGIGRYYRALLRPSARNAKLITTLHEMFNMLAESDRGRALIRAMIGPKAQGKRRTKQELERCLHPLDVYAKFKHGRLQDLPTVDELLPLRPAMQAWGDEAEEIDLQKARAQTLRALHLTESHRLTDLPQLVAVAMAQKVADHAPAMANRIREQALVFARWSQGDMSPILIKLREIEEIHVAAKDRTPKVHLSPDQFWGMEEQLGEVWPIFRDMTLTGMIQKEFWGPWRIEGMGIWVEGSKTDYRPRWVPLIQPIERPCGSQYQLMKTCREIKKRIPGFRPYTARHTYSRWLQDAGIPVWGQAMLMGHSAKQMEKQGFAVAQTIEYQTGDVRAYLPGWSAALRSWLGLPPLPATLERLA